MIQLDEKKLARLRTTNQQLNEKYGEHGTDTREKFNEKSYFVGQKKYPINYDLKAIGNYVAVLKSC